MTKSNLSGVEMRRFRTQYGYWKTGLEAEKKTGLPDLCVPDQSLTVKQIRDRYQRGQDLPIYNRNLVFTGDAFTPDLRTMDLTQVDELRKSVDARIRELQAQQAEEIAKRSEEAKKRSADNDKRNKAIDDMLAVKTKSGTNDKNE